MYAVSYPITLKFNTHKAEVPPNCSASEIVFIRKLLKKQVDADVGFERCQVAGVRAKSATNKETRADQKSV
jgi:hypothetical protein